ADKNQSGYPQLRMVGLMALRSHLLLGVHFGPYSTDELTLAEALWPLLIDHSLVVLDKGFIDFSLRYHLMTLGTKRNVLVRAKDNQKWKVLRRLGSGDDLVQLTLTPQSLKEYPGLPKTMTMRAISYQRKGFKKSWLLTSLVDAEQYPTKEIVEL